MLLLLLLLLVGWCPFLFSLSPLFPDRCNCLKQQKERTRDDDDGSRERGGFFFALFLSFLQGSVQRESILSFGSFGSVGSFGSECVRGRGEERRLGKRGGGLPAAVCVCAGRERRRRGRIGTSLAVTARSAVIYARVAHSLPYLCCCCHRHHHHHHHLTVVQQLLRLPLLTPSPSFAVLVLVLVASPSLLCRAVLCCHHQTLSTAQVTL